MIIRFIFSCVLSCLFLTTAWAEEKITSYDVKIDIQQDADFIITESINVISEGRNIRRGIFRDLPRFKLDDGTKIPYQYKILSVTRNERAEPFNQSSQNNAKQIRIGDPEYYLPRGPHNYVITYEVKNEIRYFDDFDEVYWNAIGTYWDFPIDKATATIRFPQAISPQELNCFTGGYKSSASDCAMSRDGQNFYIEALSSLSAREGMAVSIKFNKGIIDPPSASDKRMIWWFKHGALALLTFSFVGLLSYYYRAWNKIGRDPQKGPVFARYGPPEGYSPAAVHHVYYRGMRGHTALIASLIQLGIKNQLNIDTHDKLTTLTAVRGRDSQQTLPQEEATLLSHIIPIGKNEITLGNKYNNTFTAAYLKFKKSLGKTYGKDYFHWNHGYSLIGIVLSIIAVVASFTQFYGNNSQYFFVVLGILIAMNLLFIFLMPAPTDKGQKTRTEIEGFKLYLETAEKLQLNAAKPGSDQPPPMSTKRYERFLPFAIALGVEKPWTKHFEKLLPEEARNYNPGWSNMRAGDFGSMSGMNRALTSNLNSGVAKSMPQSSSSSGSGGGGFSGGGGGGGGGGGW